jgi:hypothetical protein
MAALFPDIDVNKVGKDNDPVTQFEQLVITKMRFRRCLELTFLGFVWERNRTRIGSYVSVWAPRLAAAGLDLSILDVTKELLDDCLSQEYIDSNIRHVGALIDGKDIMVDTSRQDSLVASMTYSDKVKHSAQRGLTWTSPDGLTTEHSKITKIFVLHSFKIL